jgi:hypothetical protein
LTRVCFPSSSTAADAVATLGAVRDRSETDEPGWPGLSPRATRRMLRAIAELEGCGEPQHEKELQSRMDQQASELKKFPEAVVKT